MSNSEKLSEKEVWSPVERTLLPADPQKLSEDPYKHLNYLDQQDGFMFAAWGFMEKRGFGMDQWHRKFGMKVFVRHLEIDFLKEFKKEDLSIGSTVAVETAAKVGDTSITFAQRMLDRKLNMISGSTMVVVAIKDGQPARVPDEFRKAVYGG